MTTLVLHIGSPKAGSSSIQESARSAHWDNGWILIPPNPFSKPYPNGFIVSRYLRPKNLPRYLFWRREHDSKRYEQDCKRYQILIQRMLKPFWGSSPVGAFHSCEYLWRLPRKEIYRLRREFESLGVTRFLIVAYIREPVSMYASALQQWARMSTNLDRFNPDIWRYEFRKRLSAWADVFGSDLVVRPLIRTQLHGQSVVTDLHQSVDNNLGTSSGFPVLSSCAEANLSQPLEALLAVHELLSRYPGAEKHSQNVRSLNRLWKQLNELRIGSGEQSMSVRSDLCQKVFLRHRDDLSWLSAHWGISFPESSHNFLSESSTPESSVEDLRSLSDFLQGSPRPDVYVAYRECLEHVQLARPSLIDSHAVS